MNDAQSNDRDLERIKARHPDIPQDPLPVDWPDAIPKRRPWRAPKAAASVRFATCPKCLANREIGVIRLPDGAEVFRDHNKVIGKGVRVQCPGSGHDAPPPKELP